MDTIKDKHEALDKDLQAVVEKYAFDIPSWVVIGALEDMKLKYQLFIAHEIFKRLDAKKGEPKDENEAGEA
jgi:hypothetical protein